MRPRAITGLGIASALGVGREAFRSAIQLGSRVEPSGHLQSFDASAYGSPRVAEVPDFDATRYLGGKGLRSLDRLTKLLIVSARLAVHDAGVKKDGAFVASWSPERVGLVCSNAYGSLEAITELDRVAVLEDARYINPAKFPNTVSNSAAGYVSIWEELRAMNVSVSDGNCGALDAVECADIYLETDRADAILVGGGEAMSEALYLAFQRLGTQATTLLGEGAALFVVEPLEAAKRRGATIVAQIVGYGTAFVSPENESSLLYPSIEAMQRAITKALADASLKPTDIDVVASGLSGVLAFDEAELAAIGAILDAPIAAPKMLFGETLGAGGAMAMAAALAWFDGAPVAPVIRGARPAYVKTVLVTSMGYYGNASAVVMRA